MSVPDFWNDHATAGRLSQEVNRLKEELAFWRKFEGDLTTYAAMSDADLAAVAIDVQTFTKEFDRRFAALFLAGPYDNGDALVTITAGAGGVDAQDWAAMLVRMYQKYAEQVGYTAALVHRSLGEQGGIKSATLDVLGRASYGMLKGEAGVHRLVRVSPFAAGDARHTSFALVEVLPQIPDAVITLNPTDLSFDTYRSSGPGGQNVNKLETAVRVTHIPTGLVVAVQSERSQQQNKEKALALLRARLAKLMEQHKVVTLNELKAKIEPGRIEWGSQIRSYVLNPYKLVKDHRTGAESTQPDAVLNGDIEQFIEAELTHDNLS